MKKEKYFDIIVFNHKNNIKKEYLSWILYHIFDYIFKISGKMWLNALINLGALYHILRFIKKAVGYDWMLWLTWAHYNRRNAFSLAFMWVCFKKRSIWDVDEFSRKRVLKMEKWKEAIEKTEKSYITVKYSQVKKNL